MSKIIEAYLAYDNSANYPITGMPNEEYAFYPIRYPEEAQDYNSNSFAGSICNQAGGTNCQYLFIKPAPGIEKLIPNLYFKYKNK